MPVLGITHAAHSAVIKTPDFPQDSSSSLTDEKVTRMSKILSPLHLGRKTIFLDGVNETMTAVSSEKIEQGRKAKERGNCRVRVGGNLTVSLYISFFFFNSHSKLQHQTGILLSRVSITTDSVFSTPCCDPETPFRLRLDTQY